jgi:5-methyltetrahydrofolate--homocysteine methyltransferase
MAVSKTMEEITTAVIDGDLEKVTSLTRDAIGSGVNPMDIFHQGLFPGMDVVGKKMQSGEFFLPEVLMSARAMRGASDLIKSGLEKGDKPKPIGTVAIGTVNGDLHDIGKNIVIMLLEGAGFQVMDLGTDVPVTRFVEVVQSEKPDILGLSALLSVTMVNMKDVIAALQKAGQREAVKIMIGGAIASQQFANDIGADGFAPDAPGAVELAKRLMGG